MTDWKTIKVPPEDKERADEIRPDESTWGECVVAGAKELADAPNVTATATVRPQLDEDRLDEITNKIRDQLDVLALTEADVERIESSLSTIEERTGEIDRKVEQLGGQR